MSYSLRAIVGDYQALTEVDLPSSAKVVRLQENLGLIPLTDELYGQLADLYPSAEKDDSLKELTDLTPAIVEWMRSLSKNRMLAYLEAEYYDGAGEQGAAVWNDSNLLPHPRPGCSVNLALQALGVAAKPPDDEFDTVGLGRHRRPERWLT